MNKIEKPHNELIFRVAVNLAAIWFEAARSSGYNLTDKADKSYKNNTARFARENLELFVPHAVNHLIDMLKPTSNCTEFMRMEIYEALMGYQGDLNPISIKSTLPQLNFAQFDKALKKFEKNKINMAIFSKPEEKKIILHNTDKPNPFRPKAN